VFISRTRDETVLDELAQSIREFGLIVPVTVVKKHDGGYELLKGQGRVLAHKKLGLDRIKAIVMPEGSFDTEQKTIEWLVENRVRERLPAAVKARLAELDERQGASLDDIGRKYRISTSTAKQYIGTVRKSSPELMRMVDRKELDFTHARTIVDRVPTKQTQESLGAIVAEQKLSLQDTRTLAEMAAKESRDSKPLTITDLKDRIRGLNRSLEDAASALQAKKRRLDALLRHTRVLLAKEQFRTLLGNSESRLAEVHS
jgi:ParB family chromosome partitioning protein